VGEEELEELRNKKIKERLLQYQQAREIELKKKIALRYVVDGDAYERLMNVRLANPVLYDQVVTMLLYLQQNGQIKGKVSDAQLKEILAKLTARKEPEIEIKRK
jgi:programmed cell death protein 5